LLLRIAAAVLAAMCLLPQALPARAAGPEEETFHVLLLGLDQTQGAVPSRADAVILCSVGKGTLTLTSFLRDMLVEIPGHGSHKLNAAYPLGGGALMKQTLEESFGIRVDAVAEVDFRGFQKAVDALGGVEVSITREEAAYLDSLMPGRNRLNGASALQYVRLRKLGTDFARAARQRTLLQSVLKEIQSAGPGKLLRLLEGVLPWVRTDLSKAEILRSGIRWYPELSSLELRQQQIPGEGTYRFGDAPGVRDCILVDLEANRRILRSTLPG